MEAFPMLTEGLHQCLLNEKKYKQINGCDFLLTNVSTVMKFMKFLYFFSASYLIV